MTTIDVHAHVGTPTADQLIVTQPGYAAQLAEEGRSLGPASADYNRAHIASLMSALTDPGMRLNAMDSAGVDIQMVSATPIARPWVDEDLSRAWIAEVNGAVAAHCAEAPDRLVPIAAVTLHHPELAADQLEDAVRNQGAAGVQISTRAAPGMELDDPRLDVFWARAVALDVPVLIHPWGCSLDERLNVGYMFNHVGNPTETSVALNRLIFGGTLDRHPALRTWAAHGGGWLPSYHARADHAWEQRADARTCEHPPSWYLRRMWFDSLVYSDPALRFLVESVGSTQVTIGSDYPFDMGVPDAVARVHSALPDTNVRDDVCSRSAMALFGRHLTGRVSTEAHG